MNRSRALLVLAAVSALAFALSRPSAAQTPSGRVFVYVMAKSETKQAKQTYDLYRRIINLIFQKMGEQVNIIELPRNQIVPAAKAGKFDFTLLPQADYVELVNAGRNITPVLAMTPKGHIMEYRCVVVPKDAAYDGPQSLRGKRILKPFDLSSYYGLRWFIKSGGADMPLDKFFSALVPFGDESMAIDAVANGKLDAAVVSAAVVDFKKYADSTSLKKVTVTGCHELSWPSGPIVWVGTPDPAKLQKFYDVIRHLDTFPEFRQFKPILNIVKIQFYLVAKKDYAEMVKTFSAAKKNGWAAEFARLK